MLFAATHLLMHRARPLRWLGMTATLVCLAPYGYAAIDPMSVDQRGSISKALDKSSLILSDHQELTLQESIGNYTDYLVTGELDIDVLREQASQGDTTAQVALATLAFDENQHEKAINWLEQAVSGGDATAKALLGSCLSFGFAIEKDTGRGLKLISASAEEGDATGMTMLGSFYLEGFVFSRIRPRPIS